MPAKNYILIKREGPDRNGRDLTAMASAKLLLDARSWPIWDSTRNRSAIATGDNLAIYLTGSSEIIATATVSKIDRWNAVYANRYPLTLDGTPLAVIVLGEVQFLNEPVKVRDRLEMLSFINPKGRKWGVAFMGGCRAVNDEDFRILTTTSEPTNMEQQSIDPFKGLVAQVTNSPLFPDTHGVKNGIKRTVHCLMSRGDDEEDTKAMSNGRVPKQGEQSGAGGEKYSESQGRQFTPAEKSLIQRMHRFTSASELLGILNERMSFDLGAAAVPYRLEQVSHEISQLTHPAPVSGKDWVGMRKLINQARKDGVMPLINEQVINDFAVVFSLNTRQVLALKDVLLEQNEEDES